MTKNNFQRTALIVAFAASTLALSACQNLSSPTVRFDRQVNYGDAKGVELVTNEFGSSDLQMIAEKMTGSLLETGIFQGRPHGDHLHRQEQDQRVHRHHQRDELDPDRAGQVGQGAFHAAPSTKCSKAWTSCSAKPERPVQAEHHRRRLGQIGSGQVPS